VAQRGCTINPVQTLGQRVIDYIGQEGLLKPGHRLGIAVSGGLDSVALLRLALELRAAFGVVLAVVHFNHRLRGDDSEADERFVAGLAKHHNLDFHCEGADVSGHSHAEGLSLEAAARELRYNFFRKLLKEKTLDRVATAHTLDDQAETVILRLARGAGTRGLAGIYPEIDVPPGKIIRPLLQTKRAELEAYLQSLNQESLNQGSLSQDWREDKSNDNLCHTRNRVRHKILPVLERELNPSLREALAETASVARDEEEYWTSEVERVLPQVAKSDTVNIPRLLALPKALQRRILRQVAESLNVGLELKHVREILRIAQNQSTSMELPDGWSVVRAQNELRFEKHTDLAPTGYEYPLSVPGGVEVPETSSRFEAATSSSPEGLDASLLKQPLIVRNWRPGDRFWPAHSKAAKKVKELLQERKITGTERNLWPVVASGNDIVWLRGFPLPAQYRSTQPGQPAVAIREVPSQVTGLV
jgi:tRNA(Ile)-lysidine synthase